jgi:Lipocalin-like domain
MRRTMLAVTIVALSLPVSAAEYEFYGTYRLISTTRTVLDTGQIITFHGETGFITYGKDRRMMILAVRGDRPKAESIEKMTDQQRAVLHRSMTAYAGTYKFDGNGASHRHLLERGMHRNHAGQNREKRRR